MALADRIRHAFVDGLLLVTPLVVTAFVLSVLAGWATTVLDPVVAWTGLAAYTANDRLVAQLLAAVCIVVGVTLLGWLAQRSLGRTAFGRVGRVVNIVPLVNTIYSSVRQVATALVERDTRFESVVLVEYPRDGLYSVGLVTGDSPSELTEGVSDEDRANGTLHSVFLPNSPNPTGGRLVVVPEKQITEVDMSVRRGMRFIVTTGMGMDEEVIEGRLVE